MISKKFSPTNTVVFLGLIFLFTACRSEPVIKMPEVMDGGLLTEQPCGPPCFWNILPGITTKDQVIAVLKDRRVFQACEFFDYSQESGNRGFVCKSIISVSLQYDTNIVKGVGFRPSQEITVSEVVAKYGIPDAVLVTPQGIPEAPPRVSMILYYDEINTRLVLPDQDSAEYELAPTTLIVNITYSERSSYEASRKYYSAIWKGYGTYDEYYNR